MSGVETETEAAVDETVLAAVREDPQLAPAEKETVFRFAKDEDVVHVHTDEPALGRKVLAHREADARRVVLLDGDARPRVPVGEWDGEPIVATSAELPVGAFSVKSQSRQSAQHARIVSDRVYEHLEEGEP